MLNLKIGGKTLLTHFKPLLCVTGTRVALIWVARNIATFLVAAHRSLHVLGHNRQNRREYGNGLWLDPTFTRYSRAVKVRESVQGLTSEPRKIRPCGKMFA